VVFPAFLFIVGLSIPLGVNARIKAGDSDLQVARHIALRALALIIMGFFHVNLESYGADALLPRPLYQILVTISFFLIWLDYAPENRKKYYVQIIGIVSLLILALLYRGRNPEHPGMSPHWWGILGLIGWAYVITATIYLLLKDRIWAHALVFIFFLAFLSASKLHWLSGISFLRPYVWINSDGADEALAMAGIITTLVYRRCARTGNLTPWWIFYAGFAAALLAFGYLTRPLWGIHKLGATPSWVTICAALTLLLLGVLIWWTDMKGNKNTFNLIKPAGTSTLTAYLLPYIHYALYTAVGAGLATLEIADSASLPLVMRTGLVGVIKCLCYSLVIILITGWLEKRKLRLKL